jgi:SAM-dependent methyltransferase
LAAKNEGLSVCDYVEKLWDKQGDTQAVIDNMAKAGALTPGLSQVLEIGTGTGRYLEKVVRDFHPQQYSSYETDPGWAQWLEQAYPVHSLQADGQSLGQTPDRSVNLVHAHGVFVYLPLMVSYRYWKEIWRVTADQGYVVFDIISEECLDKNQVQRWLDSGHNYPCFLGKDYVVGVFAENGFQWCCEFSNRYGEGTSLYLVFQRAKTDS